MTEKWKDIAGFEGFYQVSNFGSVRTVTRNQWNGNSWHLVRSRVIKPSVQNSGYLRLVLSANGTKKYKTVHRLVAEAFLDKPDVNENLVVNHKDENKLNNRADNLEWVTIRENNTYNKRQEKISAKKRENGVYERLSKQFSKPVIAIPIDKSKPTINLKSVTDGKNYGFNPSEISAVAKGRKKTHYGYTFKYL
jgi:hypothetical protein|nr:MAG TPA: homing endonuclease [Caudoviricetes sp.]